LVASTSSSTTRTSFTPFFSLHPRPLLSHAAEFLFTHTAASCAM
jgi:hypothetical protein